MPEASPRRFSPKLIAILLGIVTVVALIFVVNKQTLRPSLISVGSRTFNVETMQAGQSAHLEPGQHGIFTAPTSVPSNQRWLWTWEMTAPQGLKIYEFTPGFVSEKADQWNGKRYYAGSATNDLYYFLPGATYYVKANSAFDFSFTTSQQQSSASSSFSSSSTPPNPVVFVGGFDNVNWGLTGVRSPSTYAPVSLNERVIDAEYDRATDSIYFMNMPTPTNPTFPTELVRIKRDGSDRTVLYSTINVMQALTIDPIHSYIYWTEYREVGTQLSAAIYRMNLDGTNNTLIAAFTDTDGTGPQRPLVPTELHYDQNSQKIYFVAQDGVSSAINETTRVYSISTNGTGLATVVDINGIPGADPLTSQILRFTLRANTIYWTEYYSAAGQAHARIRKQSLGAGSTPTVLFENVTSATLATSAVTGIDFDEWGYLYWTLFVRNPNNTYDLAIQRANVDTPGPLQTQTYFARWQIPGDPVKFDLINVPNSVANPISSSSSVSTSSSSASMTSGSSTSMSSSTSATSSNASQSSATSAGSSSSSIGPSEVVVAATDATWGVTSVASPNVFTPLQQTEGVTDLEYDVQTDTLYYISTGVVGNKIVRMNRDGSNPTVIHTSVNSIRAFAIDSPGRRIFWADYLLSNSVVTVTIYRMGMDGSGITPLISYSDPDGPGGDLTALAPFEMVFDSDAQKLYFVATDNLQSTGDNDASFIYRINADGTNQQTVVDISGVSNRTQLEPEIIYHLFLYNHQLYWTDYMNQDISGTTYRLSRIMRQPTIGGTPEVLYQRQYSPGTSEPPISGIAIDGTNNQLYWSRYGANPNTTYDFFVERASLGGALPLQPETYFTRTQIPGFAPVFDLEFLPPRSGGNGVPYAFICPNYPRTDGNSCGHMIYNNKLANGANFLLRSTLNGTDALTIASTIGLPTHDENGVQVADYSLAGMHLDSACNALYVGLNHVVDNTFDMVRMDPYGNNNVTLFSDIGKLVDVDIDTAGGWIYYVGLDEGGDGWFLKRSSWDGSVRENIFFANLRIAVDAQSNLLYFSNFDEQFIGRSQLSGGTFEVLYTTDTPPEDIVIDQANNAIYWSEPGDIFGLYPAKVMRGSLDGTVPAVQVVAPPNAIMSGLGLDTTSHKVYWSDLVTNSLSRAPAGGGGTIALVSQAAIQPSDLVIDAGAECGNASSSSAFSSFSSSSVSSGDTTALRITLTPSNNTAYMPAGKRYTLLRGRTEALGEDMIFSLSKVKNIAPTGALTFARNYELWVDTNGDGSVDKRFATGAVLNGALVFPRGPMHGNGRIPRLAGPFAFTVIGLIPEVPVGTDAQIQLQLKTEDPDYLGAKRLASGTPLSGIRTDGTCSAPLCEIDVKTARQTLFHFSTTSCFLAGTPITLADGTSVPIEQLTTGDRVRGWNEATGTQENASVAATISRLSDHYYVLTTPTRSLSVTGEHPMWSRGTWTKVKDLVIGDTLTTIDGLTEAITSIQKIDVSVPVYNLTVDGVHTYYADGVLVHNKSTVPCTSDASCGMQNCTGASCVGGFCDYGGQLCVVVNPPCQGSSCSSRSSSSASSASSCYINLQTGETNCPQHSSSSDGGNSGGNNGSSSGGGASSSSGGAADSGAAATGTDSAGSCPFIYAWDGTKYVLEHEATPLAILATLEATSHQALDSLKGMAGDIKLKLSEERDETSYVDSVKLTAVDVADATVDVRPDVDGALHTLGTTSAPTRCERSVGGDCTASVTARDHDVATITPDEVLTDGSTDTTNYLSLTFAKPADAKRAKLLFHVEKNPIMQEFLLKTRDWVGNRGYRLGNAVFSLPILRDVITKTFDENDLYLFVDVWNGSTWNEVGTIKTGDYRNWDDFLVTADVSGISGETLQVRLRSTAWYMTDAAAVDYSDDLPLTTAAVPLVSAEKNGGLQVTSFLTTDDGDHLTLEHGDTTELHFNAQDIPANMKRHYIVDVTGYYLPHGPRYGVVRTIEGLFSISRYLLDTDRGIQDLFLRYLSEETTLPATL